MVSNKSVERQLKKIKFNNQAWGRAEIRELPKILMAEEEIYECVNGIYEGGFALLVATNIRLLLIDKKPLNFLTVEDLRFDMITELDYSHRLIGAQINIAAGSRNLKFKSYNQPRLRKLINHVQHCMAESKKKQSDGQEDQKQHLEQINQQLQAYLIAQHQQQQELREQLEHSMQNSSDNNSDNKPQASSSVPKLPQLTPQLSDYLFAQSLLKQYRDQEKQGNEPDAAQTAEPRFDQSAVVQNSGVQVVPQNSTVQTADLQIAGEQEIFGRKQAQPLTTKVDLQAVPTLHKPLEINPLTIAYSKLPMALRNRKFGRPSFHAHSRRIVSPQQ